ncbi:NAD(P)H-dependent oxidoreductase subunit E [Paraburkholderia bonniea]|uniref:NAD(P)H-dependent oxidoreductase subunit E n=1 Tax=Paraburkholderia bonniea TaxID=2152891 RepID=UPI00129120D2|nr:NAD(P)H-dependent oxidoreductase subunit E [Paraburkholderia bonniea]WJF91369.1 NAD(P)H-dependent oxidoreductase subunit E [Paraburkholderia bonniea]WJF94686.1 NAD(P)H-dependent oxidoreductase subunit E [Paraburkholderia bonniea]
MVQRHLLPGRSLLAVLHAIQDETGFVPPETVAPLAQGMNLSRAEVHGVLTYYHHFRTQPPPALTLQLCRAEACRSMGTEALAVHIEACTGERFDTQPETSRTARHPPTVGLESVYCLGQCALSPALTLNGTLHAKVTPQKFDALLALAHQQVLSTVTKPDNP